VRPRPAGPGASPVIAPAGTVLQFVSAHGGGAEATNRHFSTVTSSPHSRSSLLYRSRTRRGDRGTTVYTLIHLCAAPAVARLHRRIDLVVVRSSSPPPSVGAAFTDGLTIVHTARRALGADRSR